MRVCRSCVLSLPNLTLTAALHTTIPGPGVRQYDGRESSIGAQSFYTSHLSLLALLGPP